MLDYVLFVFLSPFFFSFEIPFLPGGGGGGGMPGAAVGGAGVVVFIYGIFNLHRNKSSESIFLGDKSFCT